MSRCPPPTAPQDTAAALGMWLEDRRARDTSTAAAAARFRGPRLAGDALAGLKPWQGSPPPPLITTPPPPPPPPFFNMALPHTWFTKLLICSWVKSTERERGKKWIKLQFFTFSCIILFTFNHSRDYSSDTRNYRTWALFMLNFTSWSKENPSCCLPLLDRERTEPQQRANSGSSPHRIGTSS